VLFGAGPQPTYDWDGPQRTLRVRLPAERSAVLLSIGPDPDDAPQPGHGTESS